jgi:hypothetical protein
MADAAGFVKKMKQAAVEAVEASKPADAQFGTVIRTDPLAITTDQKTTLGAKQLVLSRNVTDHTVFLTIQFTTGNTSGGSGEASFASHNHSCAGNFPFTVHHALQAGDRVILLRQAGGQKYIVLDRIGGGMA